MNFKTFNLIKKLLLAVALVFSVILIIMIFITVGECNYKIIEIEYIFGVPFYDTRNYSMYSATIFNNSTSGKIFLVLLIICILGFAFGMILKKAKKSNIFAITSSIAGFLAGIVGIVATSECSSYIASYLAGQEIAYHHVADYAISNYTNKYLISIVPMFSVFLMFACIAIATLCIIEKKVVKEEIKIEENFQN